LLNPVLIGREGRGGTLTVTGSQKAGPAWAGRGLPIRKRGLVMDTWTKFLDCPAYMDRQGAERCGLPAVVEDCYAVRSLDGPLDSVRIRCPRGHWFNGPVDALTWQRTPAAADAVHAPAASAALPGFGGRL
jgi:hypothetical protein